MAKKSRMTAKPAPAPAPSASGPGTSANSGTAAPTTGRKDKKHEEPEELFRKLHAGETSLSFSVDESDDNDDNDSDNGASMRSFKIDTLSGEFRRVKVSRGHVVNLFGFPILEKFYFNPDLITWTGYRGHARSRAARAIKTFICILGGSAKLGRCEFTRKEFEDNLMVCAAYLVMEELKPLVVASVKASSWSNKGMDVKKIPLDEKSMKKLIKEIQFAKALKGSAGKSKRRDSSSSSSSDSDDKGPMCFKCGKRGHIKRNCPDRKAKDKAPEKEKAPEKDK